MFKKLAVACAISLFAISAFAVDKSDVKETIELSDGSNVYIFKDGKMGMEDKLGRPTSMKAGHAMKTKDGKTIIMIGNEVMRVDTVLGKVRAGG